MTPGMVKGIPIPVNCDPYVCRECSGCPHKKGCIKGNHSKKPLEERDKTLYVSKKFLKFRKEDLERIQSPEGCELGMNRSI